MYKLRDEGKIRIIGQSAYKHDDFVKLIPKVKPEVLQSRSNAIDEGVLQDNSPTRLLMEKIIFLLSHLVLLHKGCFLVNIIRVILHNLNLVIIVQTRKDLNLKVWQSLNLRLKN